MKHKKHSKDFIYRKLKITDYNEFKDLFYSCFNRKVSFEFFKESFPSFAYLKKIPNALAVLKSSLIHFFQAFSKSLDSSTLV